MERWPVQATHRPNREQEFFRSMCRCDSGQKCSVLGHCDGFGDSSCCDLAQPRSSFAVVYQISTRSIVDSGDEEDMQRVVRVLNRGLRDADFRIVWSRMYFHRPEQLAARDNYDVRLAKFVMSKNKFYDPLRIAVDSRFDYGSSPHHSWVRVDKRRRGDVVSASHKYVKYQ